MLSPSGERRCAGAVDTAVDALRRAPRPVDPAARRAADVALIHALALAGRLDEAVRWRTGRGRTPWPARCTSSSPRRRSRRRGGMPPALTWTACPRPGRDRSTRPASACWPRRSSWPATTWTARVERRRDAMAAADAAPEIACHALQLLGRSHRVHDLDRARGEFERAHERAVRADLPVPRLRALHELGTIDLLDHGGVERLSHARAVAERLGLLSTVAVLDVELAGAHLQRFAVTDSLEAAHRAVTLSATLRLGRTRAIAHVFEACVQAVRGDREAGRAAAAEARRAAARRRDRGVHRGRVERDGRAAVGLATGRARRARGGGRRPQRRRAQRPRALPGALAAGRGQAGRADAADAAAAVRRSGVAVNRVNRGFLAYADAVCERSVEAVRRGDADLGHFPTWRDIGRSLVGEAALRDGWGRPRAWLAEARTGLAAAGLEALSRHCDRLLGPVPAGSTPREADVLGPTGRRRPVQPGDRRAPAAVRADRREARGKPAAQGRCPFTHAARRDDT